MLNSTKAVFYRQKYEPIEAALRCLVFRIIIRAQEHFEAPPVICSQLYFDVNILKQEQIFVNISTPNIILESSLVHFHGKF
jgi:hypothetical protein